MAKIVSYAPVNSLRFVYQTSTNALYQNLPFDLNTPPQCYFQKRQTDDTETVQWLSDYALTFKVYNLHTNALVSTITPTTPATNIVGQTFSVYEFEIVYAGLGVGDYYAVVTYTDDSSILRTYQSEPIQVLAEQPNTILFQYTNSENNYSVVFETGIVFNLRVEGCLNSFRPSFVEVIYNDQQQNATKLNSVPYREFTLQIGNAPGVPDWMGDLINRVMSCDEIMIDGIYYEKTSGEKWDIKRADPSDQNSQTFAGYSLAVTYVENRFLDKLAIGETPAGDYLPVQKELNYFNQAADLPIPNVFKKYSLLEKIVIYRTGDVFDFKIGLTNGGNEIYENTISDLISTEHIDYAFPSAQTIYLTGITAADILIVYKQLDTLPITVGSPNPYANLGVGAVVIYETPSGQSLSVDFNLGTGLGNADTEWYGWAICDGRNGTLNRGAVWPVGYVANTAPVGDPPSTPYSNPGDIVMNDGIVMKIENLIAHDHITDMHNNLAGAGHSIGGQGTSGDGSHTSVTGLVDPVPMPVIPSYIVSLWVKKIASNG